MERKEKAKTAPNKMILLTWAALVVHSEHPAKLGKVKPRPDGDRGGACRPGRAARR